MHPLTRPRTIPRIDWDIAIALYRKARLAPLTAEQRTDAWERLSELRARQAAREAGEDYGGDDLFSPPKKPARPPCPYWPGCGCGTQSGPHACEWEPEDAGEDYEPQGRAA